MATYTIEPERRTLHGRFSREYPPVLTINSGDTVRYRTLDAGWGLEPRTSLSAQRKSFSPREKERDDGHALCGPIAIRGAEPGMTLEIRINEILPGPYGWTVAGAWDNFYRKLGIAEQDTLLSWTIDAETMSARDQFGHTIALHPFMGVMGMPPHEAGYHETGPPRFCGGNIDCKELVAGSTLYLPIAVQGGLFSVGDGHGAQGDGEVSGTAIECPMDVVDLTFHLRDDLHLTTPCANTPAGWLTLGFHEDLHEATRIALDAMLSLLEEHYQLQRTEALALASLVVDMRITQIVNGAQGVHALLPHGIIK